MRESYNPYGAFTVTIALSNKIMIQKRVVYDLYVMLGDIGGFYDFFSIMFTQVFGFFATRLMHGELALKLFSVSTD